MVAVDEGRGATALIAPLLHTNKADGAAETVETQAKVERKEAEEDRIVETETEAETEIGRLVGVPGIDVG